MNDDGQSGKPLKNGSANTGEAGHPGVRLGTSRYGKSRVRVARVTRGADGVHVLRELSVDVLAEGDFEASFLAGDNALVLPTDTMKNTLYVLGRPARDRRARNRSALLAGRFFLERNPAMRRVEMTLRETRWERLVVGGRRCAPARLPGRRASGTPDGAGGRRARRRTAGWQEEVESGDRRPVPAQDRRAPGSPGYPARRPDHACRRPTTACCPRMLTGPLAVYGPEPTAGPTRPPTRGCPGRAAREVFAREYSVSVQATLLRDGHGPPWRQCRRCRRVTLRHAQPALPIPVRPGPVRHWRTPTRCSAPSTSRTGRSRPASSGR